MCLKNIEYQHFTCKMRDPELEWHNFLHSTVTSFELKIITTNHVSKMKYYESFVIIIYRSHILKRWLTQFLLNLERDVKSTRELLQLSSMCAYVKTSACASVSYVNNSAILQATNTNMQQQNRQSICTKQTNTRI